MQEDDTNWDVKVTRAQLEELDRLATPGRGLTLGQLREVYGANTLKIEQVVGAIITLEDTIVDTVVRWAIGQERATRFAKEQEKDAKDLAKLYIEAGLATGLHQAEQLVRDLETRARRVAPPSPSH